MGTYKASNWFYQAVHDLWYTFSNEPGQGHSKRAWAAFTAVSTAIFITAYKLPPAQQFSALVVWIVFACICLGLITIPELLKWFAEVKNGKTVSTSTSEIKEVVNGTTTIHSISNDSTNEKIPND